MLEKTKFVLAYQDGLYAMTELCERFSISRKTGYKWAVSIPAGARESCSPT